MSFISYPTFREHLYSLNVSAFLALWIFRSKKKKKVGKCIYYSCWSRHFWDLWFFSSFESVFSFCALGAAPRNNWSILVSTFPFCFRSLGTKTETSMWEKKEEKKRTVCCFSRRSALQCCYSCRRRPFFSSLALRLAECLSATGSVGKNLIWIRVARTCL